jgi:hypothetical protein
MRLAKSLALWTGVCDGLRIEWMKTMIKKITPFLLMILLVGSPALADVPNRPSQRAVQVPGVPNLYKISDNRYSKVFYSQDLKMVNRHHCIRWRKICFCESSRKGTKEMFPFSGIIYLVKSINRTVTFSPLSTPQIRMVCSRPQ